MSLSAATRRVSYAGNGSTTAFSFPYKFFANADIVVVLRVNSTGVETTKTITTHYTVTGVGESAGGTVTMVTAPAVGETLTLYADPAIAQGLDLTENDSLPAESVEAQLDKLVIMLQRLKDRVDRTVRLTDGYSASFDPKLPALLTADSTIVVNDAGTAFELGPTVAVIEAAATQATNAAASASSAATSASNASTSATNAASSASAAASSATAAQAAVNSAAFRDVIFITSADSPLTIVDATHRGKLICCDTSSGAITINLPQISTLNLTTAFVLGIKKTSSDGNSVTVARGGTDTIDGATSKIHSAADSGAVYIPDTDTAPDEWTTAEFGASAGNMTIDRFSGNGSTTGFTLSVDPGSENNTDVFISGLYQQKDTYSVSGTTLTFTSAPPTGTNNIEVRIGTTLSIGTPSDGSVTKAKLSDTALYGDVTSSKTSAYSVVDADDIVPCNASGAAFTVTLPAASGRTGKRVTIVKTDSSVNAVTIDGNGAETINGSADTTLNTQYESVALICDGTGWYIEQRRIPGEIGNETWTDNQTNATTSVQIYRFGPFVKIVGRMSFTGVSVGGSSLTIPAAYTPDTAIYPSPTNSPFYVGLATFKDTSVPNWHEGWAAITGASTLGLYVGTAGGTYFQVTNTTAAVPFTWASGDFIDFEAKWRVSGWKG